MKNASRFFYHVNISVTYTLHSINISYGLSSIWSEQNHLASATGHVWRPFFAWSILYFGVFGEKVKASCIFNYNFGRGVFSSWPFGAGKLVWYYNETLVDSIRSTEKRSNKRMVTVSYPSLLIIFLHRRSMFRRLLLIARERLEVHN